MSDKSLYFLAKAGTPAWEHVNTVMTRYWSVASAWNNAIKRVAKHYNWPLGDQDSFLFVFADGAVRSKRKVKNVEITYPSAGCVAFMAQSTIPLLCREGKLRVSSRALKEFQGLVGVIEDLPRPGWELWAAMIKKYPEAEKVESETSLGVEDFACSPGIRKVGDDYLLTLGETWTKWAALCEGNGMTPLKASEAHRLMEAEDERREAAA